MGADRPTSHEELLRMSDAQLVAHARERMATGATGLETARRCVAMVFARHRFTVRAMCAAKAPPDAVDDLEASVYERFVRTVYLRQTPVHNPGGLLVTIVRRVVASWHDRRRPGGVPLDDIADLAAHEDGYDAVAAAEFAEQLLALLTDAQRAVVWGRIWEGRSSAEIADGLDTTSGNVDVIFFRALARLRRELER